MKPNRKSAEDDKYGKINSLRLIHFVRSQEVLYNSDIDGYNDRTTKDAAWERIYKSLFPRYENLSIEIQEQIGTNVRRRWKTLRNAIAREVKKNATVENYIRKKESQVIAELEFLIPHIKSAHCAKLADELGLRDCYANVNETDEQEYDDDFNDTVDLTDMAEDQQDIKPFDTKSERSNDVPLGSNTVVPQDALYPTVQLSSIEDSSSSHNKQSLAAAWRHIDNVVTAAAAAVVNNAASAQVSNPSSNNSNWRNSYCSVVQCQEGEFMNSTLLCTNPDGDENHEDSMTGSQQQRPAKVPSPICNGKKRARCSGYDIANGSDAPTTGECTNGFDPGEAQTKILRLLTNLERRDNREQDAQDEDRMFLLSLVSDLKRVPSSKKMLLKAEIAMAIARAIPS